MNQLSCTVASATFFISLDSIFINTQYEYLDLLCLLASNVDRWCGLVIDRFLVHAVDRCCLEGVDRYIPRRLTDRA
ncbi:hypothetical protein DY000_02007491 [Brassica cretica]|uniref:Uncharacterized protein n=1 Tax=Brassica cretica TaxID=69181 RepID=A0ABQ7CIM1_BRACR|nr:hypothetical protein DY000_02007491 [Brassica cretica]